MSALFPISSAAERTGAPQLQLAKGRWVAHWDAQNPQFWHSVGRDTAAQNLRYSIFAEFLGFAIWQLFSILVIYLPQAGFSYSTNQLFWLMSLPSLVGATLRFPYTFMVARFGGRNWTIASTALLLIPVVGLSLALGNPETEFWVMLLLAASTGFGGGNFASSMANISYFYPAELKGWALGLNAAGGNLGAAVAQLAVPVAISVAAAGALNLPMATLLWIPPILLAVYCAARNMHNLSTARSDLPGTVACLADRRLWILAVLYIGTFGSFMGYCVVFPKLIVDSYPQLAALALGPASISLAFLGPLAGSLARPYGGRLADRFGGARITVAVFALMALLLLALSFALRHLSWGAFLSLFLLLFALSGVGNGSTFRMIPAVFNDERKAAAALGLISGLGAYGGFLVPQALNLSVNTAGSYVPAFFAFVLIYAGLMLLTWNCFLRRTSPLALRKV